MYLIHKSQAEESYETPIVCGGVQSNRGRGNIATNKCFALYNNLINADNSTADQYLPLKNITGWKETTPMLEARAQAAAVKILEAGMTGGFPIKIGTKISQLITYQVDF